MCEHPGIRRCTPTCCTLHRRLRVVSSQQAAPTQLAATEHRQPVRPGMWQRWVAPCPMGRDGCRRPRALPPIATPNCVWAHTIIGAMIESCAIHVRTTGELVCVCICVHVRACACACARVCVCQTCVAGACHRCCRMHVRQKVRRIPQVGPSAAVADPAAPSLRPSVATNVHDQQGANHSC